MAQVVTMVHGVLLYGVIDLYSVTGYVSYWLVCNACIIMETLCLFAGFADNTAAYLCMCKHCDNRCDACCWVYVDCVRRENDSKIKKGSVVHSVSSRAQSSTSLRTNSGTGSGHVVSETSKDIAARV